MNLNPFYHLDNILGPLNVIDQAARLGGTIANGGSVQIKVPRPGHGGIYTRNDAKDILREHGITTFGQLHDGSNFYFSVAKRHETKVKELLDIEEW